MSIASDLNEERRKAYRQEEKESLEHQGDWRQLKRLLQYLAPRKGKIALAIVLSIAVAALSLSYLVIIQYTVDEYILPGNIGGVFMMAGLLVATNVLMYFFERTSWYMIAEIGQETMRDLRLEIFEHIQAQSLRFFDKNPVGRLITRQTSDVNALNELFAQGVIGVFQQMLTLVFIVGLLLFYNWYLTLWVLLTVPLMLFAARNFRNNVYKSYRLTRVRLSRLNTFMQENLTGMRTVQANTREGRQFEIFDEHNDGHRNAHIQTVFQYALFFPIIEIITALGFALVLWKGGGQFLSHGSLVTVGELALFVSALDRFFMPIKDLSEKYNLVQSAIAAGERLFKLLDTSPTINDPEVAKPVGPLSIGIEFRNVWFAYNNDEWVLKDVSFKVAKGETIAIVGPTGSGKSTIISLLCRFYDVQKGQILIDGIDIREMRQSDLREKIAIVLQDVFLFYGTIAENIRLGRDDIDDTKVLEVSEETGFHEFTLKMENGYASGVKERGATLSTGQKQLLSFARALAFDPEILILDEATANIDTESEEKVQRAVGKLCAGRTSLVIAHRLSTIRSAHRIMVIHHGHLAEEGTHEELLAGNGLYKRLYDLQYKDSEELPV